MTKLLRRAVQVAKLIGCAAAMRKRRASGRRQRGRVWASERGIMGMGDGLQAKRQTGKGKVVWGTIAGIKTGLRRRGRGILLARLKRHYARQRTNVFITSRCVF
jgi:hypothetical protein